jgi:sterol desaturase/sphingolipid hydroxylase (fatty acid hydroxylase superfamily)
MAQGWAPPAVASAAAFLTFCAVFVHSRISTPRWLGYLLQRPEAHAIHHARGLHAFNYADLPLLDMLFGTYRNPAAGESRPLHGFHEGASARLPEMLAFRDVSQSLSQSIDRTAPNSRIANSRFTSGARH